MHITVLGQAEPKKRQWRELVSRKYLVPSVNYGRKLTLSQITPLPAPRPGKTHGRIPTASYRKTSPNPQPQDTPSPPSETLRERCQLSRRPARKCRCNTPLLDRRRPMGATRTHRHQTEHLKEAVSCQGTDPVGHLSENMG